MTCEACNAAAQSLTSGLYNAACDACSIRQVANGRELHDALLAGDFTPEYEQLMHRTFGPEWKTTAHPRVRALRERMKAEAKA